MYAGPRILSASWLFGQQEGRKVTVRNHVKRLMREGMRAKLSRSSRVMI